MITNVMLDLETLGTRPGCTILSIGAVTFDRDGIGISKFYTLIRRRSCAYAGLHEDPATIAWWRKQPAEAANILDLADDSVLLYDLASALRDFDRWLFDCDGVLMWGNGADFDNAILKEAYARCGYIELPWGIYNDRCYRTLKNLRPNITLVRNEADKHNAINDAEYQANHAIMLLNDLNGWET